MQGWGKRRNEWQFGLGIQHELLPRFSAEVTYNRRKYGNLTDSDTVNLGCDYYGDRSTVMPAEACAEGWQNYTTPPGCAISTASPRLSTRVCPTVVGISFGVDEPEDRRLRCRLAAATSRS